jgi:Spy/CpxP family protein refolding chaperone
MTTADAPSPRNSPAWLKLLLILSLTANLLVIGIIAGRELRQDGRRGGVGWILDLVPEERRELAEAHFAEARALFEADDDRGALMDAVLAAIRAEPYDPSAVEAAMAAFGESRAERWKVVRERLSTLLAELTPAERAAFADNFEERMDRWRDRRRN